MATIANTTPITLNAESIQPVYGTGMTKQARIAFERYMAKLSRPDVSRLDFFAMSGFTMDRGDNAAMKLFSIRESTAIAEEVETGNTSAVIPVEFAGQHHRQEDITYTTYVVRSSWVDDASEVNNIDYAMHAMESVYEGVMNWCMRAIAKGFDDVYDLESTKHKFGIHPGLNWVGNTANSYTGGIQVANANDRVGLNGAKILAAESIATDQSLTEGNMTAIGNYAAMVLPWATQFPTNAAEFMTPNKERAIGVKGNVNFTLNGNTGTRALCLPKIVVRGSTVTTSGRTSVAKTPAFRLRDVATTGIPSTATGTPSDTVPVSNVYLVDPENCIFYLPGNAQKMRMHFNKTGINGNTVTAVGAFGFKNLAPHKTIVIPCAENNPAAVAQSAGFPTGAYAFVDNDPNPDGTA